MGIITTYVCDVSGKQGEKKDFVEVEIKSQRFDAINYLIGQNQIKKLVHKDVAIKLGLVSVRAPEVAPEVVPTFESQLSTLLKDYIADLVYDEVADQMNK